jgi:hypothetical protein
MDGGTGGIGGNINGNYVPYAPGGEEAQGVSPGKVTVRNPKGTVSDQDAIDFAGLLDERLGDESIPPPKGQAANEEAYSAGIQGAASGAEQAIVGFTLVLNDSQQTLGQPHLSNNLTAPNTRNPVGSTSTATATHHTSQDIMAMVAQVMLQIAETQSDTQAMLGMSSQNDIFSALQTHMKAAEKKMEAAAKKKAADEKLATAEIVEGALQAGGGMVSAFGPMFKPLEGIGQAVSGVGRAAGGVLKYEAAGINYEATLDNIAGEQFQAVAQTYQSLGQRKEQSAGNMQQSFNTSVQTLKSFFDLMNQTTMTMAGNLGR